MNNRPDWDGYFLAIAQAVSRRATCLRRQYGAVIVKDNTIVSTGYNGAARGIANCNELGKCIRQELGIPAGERYELCVASHAEANAIIFGEPSKMKGATIYVAGYNANGSLASAMPCLMCRRVILNAQINRLVYLSEEGHILSMGGQTLLEWVQNGERSMGNG